MILVTLGYNLVIFLFDADKLLPTHRKRLFIVCSREGFPRAPGGAVLLRSTEPKPAPPLPLALDGALRTRTQDCVIFDNDSDEARAALWTREQEAHFNDTSRLPWPGYCRLLLPNVATPTIMHSYSLTWHGPGGQHGFGVRVHDRFRFVTPTEAAAFMGFFDCDQFYYRDPTLTALWYRTIGDAVAPLVGALVTRVAAQAHQADALTFLPMLVARQRAAVLRAGAATPRMPPGNGPDQDRRFDQLFQQEVTFGQLRALLAGRRPTENAVIRHWALLGQKQTRPSHAGAGCSSTAGESSALRSSPSAAPTIPFAAGAQPGAGVAGL